MSNHGEGKSSTDPIPEKLRPAFHVLLEAWDYAVDCQRHRWDFAVSIQRLRDFGLSDTDLRWLTIKGHAEHAREVTVEGDDGRAFRSTGNLTFTSRTCFVLTERGAERARALAGCCAASSLPPPNEAPHNWHQSQISQLQWDAESRKLRVNGQLVKRFKWPAHNQETILTAFQEEGWPERIDDPLPPQLEQDPKRRLSDTIKCLNRKQVNALIRFHGDGTGEGIVWELVEPGGETNENP